MTDLEVISVRLDALVSPAGHDVRDPLYFAVDGPPIPKGRPRFRRRGGAYTPERTRLAQSDMKRYFEEALAGRTFTGAVAVAMVFYLANLRDVDGDNLAKLVLDAGTKAGAWPDDSHVTVHAPWLELDRVHPRTLIGICDTVSTIFQPNPISKKRRAA